MKISTRLIVTQSFISRLNSDFCCDWVKIHPHGMGRALRCVSCKSEFFWIFLAHLNIFSGHLTQDRSSAIIYLESRIFGGCWSWCQSVSSAAKKPHWLEEQESSWEQDPGRQMFRGSRDHLRQSSNRALPWHQKSVTRFRAITVLGVVWDNFMSLTPG